jgi:hypothetical protein
MPLLTLFGENMDKKIAGLLGAAAALVTVGGANAAEVQGNPADPGLTYRSLLNPVPNAVEALKADEARRGSTPKAMEEAQIVIGVGHHHHHHARARVRIVPPHRHDHHHHHHHSSYYGR